MPVLAMIAMTLFADDLIEAEKKANEPAAEPNWRRY